jgi:type IV secretion system protein VirD4
MEMAKARDKPSTESSGVPASPRSEVLVVLIVLDVLVAAWITTQYLAHRLGFHPSLGPSLYAPSSIAARWWQALAVIAVGSGIVLALVRLARGSARRGIVAALLAGVFAAGAAMVASAGPVYSPLRGVGWMVRMRHARGGPALVAAGVRAFGVSFLVLFTASLALRGRRTRREPSDSHGSAAWGSGETLSSSIGLELGRLEGRVLRYNGDGHLLTVAPTRTGKGVGAVIPNLLHYPGSVVVTDPKGENYAVTARRRSELGTIVHALDPFRVVNGTASFNPLDLIDVDGPDANDDAWMIADMLVVSDGRATDDAFWNEEARALLAGLILHVAVNAPPELRTLSHMRSLLTLPPEQLQQTLTEMLESDAVDGLVARSAARLLQKADRERSGVISSAQSHTHFLDSPRMEKVLSRSSLALADLKRSRVSVYLVLPPDRMDTYRGWMRVMTACCLLAMTRVPGPPRERVLFLLDEFANLGRMRPVQRAISLAAAYGASFWLLLQDLAQLKGTYPDQWQTFIANADVLQAFGINDWETADYMSRMTGETTIHVESENESRGVSRGRNSSRQHSAAQTIAEKGRRLLMPDEVRRLRSDQQLLFVRGSEPVLARRLDYLRDTEYTGQADPNPMHIADGLLPDSFVRDSHFS